MICGEDMAAYFRNEMETMGRDELDALVDERIRYTVRYAYENPPFYRMVR
jgi:phenylacetate-coenzyme A ligase PaaK-like adenylate-forming protein